MQQHMDTPYGAGKALRWRVEITEKTAPAVWIGNNLIFDCAAEAEAYALRLKMVWTAVDQWRVKPVTHR